MTPRQIRLARGSSVTALGDLTVPAFEAAASATSAGLIVADPDGRVLMWSAGAEAIYGWSSDEAVGELARDLIVPLADRERGRAIRESVAAGSEWRGEFTCRRRDGSPVPVAVVDLPIIVDGEVRAILGVSEDLTSRRDAEAQRQALQALSDATTDAVVTVAGSTITSWNPAAERLFGWSADEVVGAEVSVLVPDDRHEECAEMLARLRRGERTQQHSTVRLHRDGTRVPVVVEMAPVHDPVTDTWLGVATVRDARERDELLEAALAAEQRIRTLMARSSEVVVLTNADGTIRAVTPSVERRGWVADELVGGVGSDFIHPDDLPALAEARERAVAGVEPHPVVLVRSRTADGATTGDAEGTTGAVGEAGEWGWREITFTNLLDDPTVQGVVSNIRDVNETVTALMALQATEARLSAIVNRSSDVALMFDRTGTIQWVSPASREVFGLEPRQLVGTSGFDLIHADDRDAVVGQLLEHLGRPGAHVTVEFRTFDRSGGIRWVEEVATDLVDDPDVGFVVANLRDVTERHVAAEEAARVAMFDQLTGLPKRNQLDELIRPHMTGQDAIGCALVCFDLDDFADVNDALGHSLGDALLVQVARRVEAALESFDATLVRFGGDQFAVVCPGLTALVDCLPVAEAIHTSFAAPFLIGGNEVLAGVSIGVTFSATADTETLLREADTALSRAKKAGRGHTVAFEPGHSGPSEQRLQYSGELRRAIDRGEIVLHYQPIVDFVTGRVVAVEALARWRHPLLGQVSPDVFIPVAESIGLIGELGAYVLREACQAAVRWTSAGHTPQLGVNVSAAQLIDPHFDAVVEAVLAETGLAPQRLHLEITETAALLDLHAAMTTMEALGRLGVSFSLDDFGTGYSSLSLLKRLPTSTLKIDRSFVDGLDDAADGDHDRQIVAGVVGIARALGLFVVAEGVETPGQADELRRLGCHFGQGYLWSPGVPERELLATVSRIESPPV